MSVSMASLPAFSPMARFGVGAAPAAALPLRFAANGLTAKDKLSKRKFYVEHRTPEQLRPKGAQRVFWQTTLRLGQWWGKTLRPTVAMAVWRAFHPKASPQQQRAMTERFQLRYVSHPDSLSNRAFRHLFPRELGIAVYGSARNMFKDPTLQDLIPLSQDLGKAIAQWGYYPVTGGGEGVMGAVARGALSAKGHSVGTYITGLDFEIQHPELYPELARQKTFEHRIIGPNGFEHRASRTLVLPGGYSTDRELYAITDNIYFNLTRFPHQRQVVILDPKGYYAPWRARLQQQVEAGLVSPERMELLKFVKTIEEARQALTNPDVPWTPGIGNPKSRSIWFRK